MIVSVAGRPIPHVSLRGTPMRGAPGGLRVELAVLLVEEQQRDGLRPQEVRHASRMFGVSALTRRPWQQPGGVNCSGRSQVWLTSEPQALSFVGGGVGPRHPPNQLLHNRSHMRTWISPKSEPRAPIVERMSERHRFSDFGALPGDPLVDRQWKRPRADPPRIP